MIMEFDVLGLLRGFSRRAGRMKWAAFKRKTRLDSEGARIVDPGGTYFKIRSTARQFQRPRPFEPRADEAASASRIFPNGRIESKTEGFRSEVS
jgi:hypothetical protein